MALILRTMKMHMGWEDAKDDYVVLDGEKSVGRIYKEHGEARWFWSVNTSPYPAPPPNNGLAKSLEEAKLEFKRRWLLLGVPTGQAGGQTPTSLNLSAARSQSNLRGGSH